MYDIENMLDAGITEMNPWASKMRQHSLISVEATPFCEALLRCPQAISLSSRSSASQSNKRFFQYSQYTIFLLKKQILEISLKVIAKFLKRDKLNPAHV